MNGCVTEHRLLLLVSLCLCLVLAGCLARSTADASFLLGQDYLRMTDTELVGYEQELSDELVRSSRSGGGDTSIGIGIGSWGSNVGYGIHADKRLGGAGASSTTLELKDRRDEVRAEMRRRGLLPQ